MKSLNLIKPIEVSVIDSDKVTSGTFEMVSDATYELVLDREGDQLNKIYSDVIVDAEVNNNFYLAREPEEGGFVARSFHKLSEFSYSLGDGSPDSFFGQSELNVLEHKAFDVDGGDYPFLKINNGRLFEYDSELYLVFEMFDSSPEGYGVFINVFRYESSLEKFLFVYKFDKPVDFKQPNSNYQYGSPDFFEIGGKAHICYRSVNRADDSNEINIYESEDMINWNLKTLYRVSNSSVDFFDFRLRSCVGRDNLMIVFYGISKEPYPGNENLVNGGIVENNDMRCIVSFDEGYSFSSNDTSTKNIETDSFTGSIRSNFNYSNMHSFFVNKFVNNQSPYLVQGHNCKFGLYFDEDMGAFVVLKGGHPNGEDNYTSLIGIKTMDGNLLTWERCLNYQIDMEANGMVPGSLDGPFTPVKPNGFYDNSYLINDLDVCSNGVTKFLMLDVTVNDNTELWTNQSRGVAYSEFRFIEDNIIPNGNYNSLFAYGGKYHNDFSFLTTVINKDYYSIYPTASPIDSHMGQCPMCCSWRNQIVSSAKLFRDNKRAYRSLAIHKPWGNVGEKFGYEFHYTGLDPAFDNYHLVKVENNSGGVSNSNRSISCDAGAFNSEAYVSITDASWENFYERPLVRTGKSTPSLWKTKVSLSFELPPDSNGTVVASLNTNGYGLKLRLNSDRTISLLDFEDNEIYTSTDVFSLDTRYDFLIGFNYFKDNSVRSFIWYKDHTTQVWTFGDISTYTKSANNTIACNFGIVESTTDAQVIELFDIAVSTYGRGYRPLTTLSKFGNLSNYYEGPINDPSNMPEDVLSTALPARFEGNSLALYDGSEVSLYGSDFSGVQSWSYSQTDGLNNTDFLTDDIVNSCFEFSDLASSGFYEVIFENTDRSSFDCFSVLNSFGCYQFDIRSGDYDDSTGAWTDFDDLSYIVPNFVLDISSFSGKGAVFTNDLIDGELVGYNVLLYNTSLNQYDTQLFVLQQLGNYIEFNNSIPDLANREVHVFVNSGSFGLEEGFAAQNKSFIRLRAYTCSNADVACIGQVVFGTVLDLTEAGLEVSTTVNSNFDYLTSSNGYSYPRLGFVGNTFKDVSIELDQMELFKGYYNKLEAFLYYTYTNGRNIVVAWADDLERRETYLCALSSPDLSENKSNPGQISLNLLAQNYRTPSVSLGEVFAPYLKIFSDGQSAYVAKNIQFYAVAEDPQGQTITYLWDFGDGTISTDQNPIKSYAENGSYVVSCQAFNVSGFSTQQILNVSVAERDIFNYNISTTGPLAQDTNHTIVFEARDKDNVRVYDSKMLFTISSFSTVEIDGVFEDSFVTVSKTLRDGRASFSVRNSAAEVIEFILEDFSGNYQTFQITFT